MYCKELKKAAFDEGITNIPFGVFESDAALVSVDIPDTVIEVGDILYVIIKGGGIL